MAGATQTTVHVGMAGDAAVVKIAGACTFSLCDRIQNWLQQPAESGCPTVYFELRQAERIDSTFAGFLISLATEKDGSPAKRVHLVSPPQPIATALETMHLMSLFDVCDGLDDSPAEWRELGQTDARPEDVAQIVIDSHEKLIEADDRNADVFGPVVERFRADVDRRRSS